MSAPVRAIDDGVEIDVQVVPRASVTRIVGTHGERLKVQLAAPPVDGAANEALVELLARVLDRPRQAVTVVAGATHKRKRLRVRGLALAEALARLGLCGLCLLMSAGCPPNTQEIDVDVVTPEDTDELEAANNVAMVLEPGGGIFSGVADGLDFDLSVSLEPDDELRTLALYLARDESLLAWGRTAAFTYAAAARGISVFLGQPGGLSTFPLVLDLPDDGLLAAAAPGRGVVLLSSTGATSYIDGFTLETLEAASLSAPPAADDGVLVGDINGGVMRVAWSDGLRAHRFDPGDDTWVDVEHVGADAVGARAGAAWVVDGDAQVLSVIGGGAMLDVVAIDLAPDDDGTLAVGTVAGLQLDATRAGASARWATRDDGDVGEEVVLFGADDPTLPVLYLLRAGAATGPVGPWRDGQCVQLDPGTDGAPVRMLCGGGTRDDVPTGDALVLTLGRDATASVELRPALLEPPMPSPLWLADDVAVYAQGESVLLPIDRATLARGEPRTGLRGRGGQTVPLEGGATLVVGGSDATGAPSARMQVFTPAVASPAR